MLGYKSLHSEIKEQETNAIYYLLRKFGLLQETITLSEVSSVTGDYGVYTYNAENNNLIITNAEPTTNYKVIFTILDADNNARTVSVTGKETNGSVNITTPSVASGELLLEKIDVVITYAREIKPISYPYNLTVTCDKDIIQSTESATITATLTQEDVAVSGETLSYTVEHDGTTIDSGTVTTDSNGEITISYTGTAAGKIDVIISYGTLLQETYEVLDCMFYDDGITGNPQWSNTYYATVTRQSTDSVITTTSSTINGNVRIDGFNGDYCIEFDFKSNGGVYPQFRYDTIIKGRIYWSSYEDGDYHHCSLTIKDNIVTGTIDGNSILSQTLNGDWNRLYLMINIGYSLYYKNFKVYPI